VPINVQRDFAGARHAGVAGKEQPYRRIALPLRVLVAALFLVVMCTSTAAPAGPHRVEVTAKRFAFVPAEITLKKGEAVDLVLTSGDVAHGVRIRELHLDLHAEKGKSAEVTFTPSMTGTFIGHCSVFCGSGHGRMTLTIHVVG
jgi:cytochrome c oxidase subunit II